MPFVTFTVRRGLSAADKSGLSEAMLEAQVAAGYHRADRFHRFLEVDRDDLLVDPRFPDYATDRTDRFMVVEVIISSGRPTGTAATIADEAVRLFGERLHFLRTSYSPSTRWSRTSRAFLLRRSGEIRRGCLSRDIGNLRTAALRQKRPLGKGPATGPSFLRSLQGQRLLAEIAPGLRGSASYWSRTKRKLAASCSGVKGLPNRFTPGSSTAPQRWLCIRSCTAP
jgi:hypothetical protein